MSTAVGAVRKCGRTLLAYGWNATSLWTPTDLNTFVTSLARRKFDLPAQYYRGVAGIITSITRMNTRRKLRLMNPTLCSVTNYRERVTLFCYTLLYPCPISNVPCSASQSSNTVGKEATGN